MERNGKKLVKLVKERGERDNISVAVIQCEESEELSSAAEVGPSMKVFSTAEPGQSGKLDMASELEQTAELPTLKPKNLEITEILQSITIIHADEVINHYG